MVTKNIDPPIAAKGDRLASHFEELKAIQFRADTEHKHGWNEREPIMLKDIRFLLGHINLITELLNSAERELEGRKAR